MLAYVQNARNGTVKLLISFRSNRKLKQALGIAYGWTVNELVLCCVADFAAYSALH
jgi:hypothetical protein